MSLKKTSAWRNSHDFSIVSRKGFFEYALLFRFLILFASACALGIFISSAISGENEYNYIIGDYFTAYIPTSIAVFIQNVIRSSLFDFILLVFAWLSALTFFCSTLLHLINIAFGGIYGICIGAIIQNSTLGVHQTLIYVLYVSVLALLCAFFSAKLLLINKKCLYSIRTSAPHGKPYISCEIKELLQEGLKKFVIYAIIRLIYCISLTLLNLS